MYCSYMDVELFLNPRPVIAMNLWRPVANVMEFVRVVKVAA